MEKKVSKAISGVRSPFVMAKDVRSAKPPVIIQ
jgi:hypothetical protein